MNRSGGSDDDDANTVFFSPFQGGFPFRKKVEFQLREGAKFSLTHLRLLRLFMQHCFFPPFIILFHEPPIKKEEEELKLHIKSAAASPPLITDLSLFPEGEGVNYGMEEERGLGILACQA